MTTTVLLVVGSGALGGGTTHVLALARALPACGVRPVVASDADGPLLSEASAAGCETHAVPFGRGRLHPAAVLALRRAMVRSGPDVVHAHGTRAAVACAVVRALPRNAAWPTVYSEHGLAADVARPGGWTRLAAAGERTALRGAARVIALSEYARARIAAIAPDVAPRVRVVPHGVAIPAGQVSRAQVRTGVGLPPDATVVGTVIRFVDQKRPLDFVAAAAAVAERRPGTAFLAVGDGPLLVAAREAARARGVPVTFAGARRDVADCLAAMDVFVLASQWEGSPLAVLEAMAAGLPVVATSVGGTPEAVRDGVTGALVPPRAPSAVAEAVLGLLSDAARARAMGAAGRDHVAASHRPEDLVRRVAAVYEEVLAP